MTTTDGRSKLRRGGREIIIPTQALALRFRIALQETEPLVWREIEVPGDYSPIGLIPTMSNVSALQTKCSAQRCCRGL